MLLDRLFRTRPVQAEVCVLDREVLGRKPAVKDGAVIPDVQPAAVCRRFVLQGVGPFQNFADEPKFAKVWEIHIFLG